MKTRFCLALILFASLMAQTGPKEVPPCRGSECTDEITGQNRQGQPKFCINHNTAEWRKNCSCQRSCDRDDHGSDCKTYCRGSRCRCDHGCKATQ